MQNLKTVVNTETADDKYSLINRDTLTQHIQIQLSLKQETFLQFFAAFSKSILNFEYFQKKDDSHIRYISEIRDSEGRS